MPELSVCKSFEFSYAHHLPQYDGKCKNNHGHTGKLEVEVDGYDVKTYPSMVCDFYDLKKRIQPVIDKVDHKDLFDVLNNPEDQDWITAHLVPLEGEKVFPPTSENMVRWFFAEIVRIWPSVSLVRIRFWESPSSYAEWRR